MSSPPDAGSSPPAAVRQDYEALVAEIRRHDELYYQRDKAVITDAEYDGLFRRLTDLEARWPSLAGDDSPSRQVGGAPVPHLKSVAHRRPMLSLSNTYSRDEVLEWHQRVVDFLAGKLDQLVFNIEPKLDGVAAELIYEQGRFVRAITRGDGKTGDDVTHTARTLVGLPRVLRTDHPPALLEVRGEVIMTHADFAAVNAAREVAGEELFVNPRNLASGTLKMLNPVQAARRPLSFKAYGLGVVEGWQPSGHAQMLQTLEDWGLPTARELALSGSLDEVLAQHEVLRSGRDELLFDVDGSVIKLDDFALQARLGERSRSPRWAIAFKFPARSGRSVVREIQVQVGRTGALTPRAVIDPVHVGGVTIEHVTLHNPDEIARLGVKVGDAVFVERAGDVIPKITAVAESGGGPAFVMPEACPVCATPAVADDEEVVVRCPNRTCPAVMRRRIEHFVARGALDVDGMGSKLVDQLVETGLVTRLSDLFALTAEQLSQLPRMGEVSAANVVAGLVAARTRPLGRFLFGLGIRHVGDHMAELVASRWPSLTTLRGVSVEELEDVAEIGPRVAQSLSAWLADPDEQAELDRMLSLGLVPAVPAPPAASDGPLTGRTFLFTGALSELSRKEAGELVKSAGGRLLSGVSKNLDVLVVGEKPGSKLKKAQELGLEVLTEQEFLTLVGR
ncbi:MAG: DNA ligase (NAD(+)) LigA [Planctomycetota bacterium]|nr:MAG: DNA ligase (NAD(+)) LigA [Planctomycetota bacterium]